MSESAPRSNPRLDNFEANKLANEQAAFEAALYDQAGVSDFSDEAKNRVEEADAYERHLENMEGRPADFSDDGYANPYMDSLHQEALEVNSVIDAETTAKSDAQEIWITSLMQNDPNVRQMQMIAEDIARIGGTVVTPENDAKLAESLKDKEDRLQELLVKFTEQSNYPKTDVDAITNRLINMTEPAPAEASDDDSDEPGVDTTEPDADAPDAPKADTADKTDVLPAPLDVTPDAVDADLSAPLDVTPDAADALPAPLDVTPDDTADVDLPAPLEVTPDAHRDKFADFLNHPAVITRNWMRTKGDKLKGSLDKFRGRSTKEKARIIRNGMGMFAVGAVALYAAKQGYDALAFNEIGNNLGDTGTGGHGIANFMSSMSDAGERTFDTASAAVSNLELHSLSPEALTAHRGEGWENQLLQMGFSRSEISPTLNELLKSTDSGVMDWVYQMRDGNPGIAKSGQIPTDVLQSIMKMRG